MLSGIATSLVLTKDMRYSKAALSESIIPPNFLWLNNLRPLHSILYFITALLVFLKHKNAFYFLALDTLIGLAAFILYHSGIYL